MSADSTARNHLIAADVIDVKQNVERESATAANPDDEKVREWAERLLKLNPEHMADRESGKTSVEALGFDLQRKSAKCSELLKKPIAALSKEADENGDIGNALADLRVQVEKLDPQHFDFEPGWVMRLLGRLPGVGSPLKRYFTRYQSVQSVIDAILKSLERGRDELSRDIVTLTEDQKRMRELTHQLARAVAMAQKLDQELQSRLDGGAPLDDERRRFIEEELLFPLRQRIIDLQQQLAVNQQGVIASELIIRNNRELIRGVNRALNVTSTALNVAATVALALEAQKRVIQKVDATAKATSDLIAGTANRLKTQGAEIHRQAASATLNIESLKSAFRDLNEAMVDLSRFRREALPQMAKSVLEFDELARESEEAIRRMESARDSRATLLSGAD